MKFSQRDVADYYNQTVDHFKIWWKLNKSLAAHYGYWDDSTNNFQQALVNTNKMLAESASVKAGEYVLDAGCGVGGTALYLSKNYNCKAKGITLSERQLQLANSFAKQFRLEDDVSFEIQDFLNTNFADNTFDVWISCESSCYATDKREFIKEAYRVLRPGGRMVIADYFLTAEGLEDKRGYMKSWGDLWAINTFNSYENFTSASEQLGFKLLSDKNITANIFKSAYRMYKAYYLGLLPSVIYNAFHNTSKFGKHHYKSGLYQYKALKSGLWEYRIQTFQKDPGPQGSQNLTDI